MRGVTDIYYTYFFSHFWKDFIVALVVALFSLQNSRFAISPWIDSGIGNSRTNSMVEQEIEEVRWNMRTLADANGRATSCILPSSPVLPSLARRFAVYFGIFARLLYMYGVKRRRAGWRETDAGRRSLRRDERKWRNSIFIPQWIRSVASPRLHAEFPRRTCLFVATYLVLFKLTRHSVFSSFDWNCRPPVWSAAKCNLFRFSTSEGSRLRSTGGHARVTNSGQRCKHALVMSDSRIGWGEIKLTLRREYLFSCAYWKSPPDGGERDIYFGKPCRDNRTARFFGVQWSLRCCASGNETRV